MKKILMVLFAAAVQACTDGGGRFYEYGLSEFSVSSRVLVRNGVGYVAYLHGPPGARQCFDLLAQNDQVDAAMAALANEGEQFEDVAQEHDSAIEMRLRWNRAINIRPGSYAVIDGVQVLSSSPYYVQNGEQIFLDCPLEDGTWKVFTVLSVTGRDYGDHPGRSLRS